MLLLLHDHADMLPEAVSLQGNLPNYRPILGHLKARADIWCLRCLQSSVYGRREPQMDSLTPSQTDFVCSVLRPAWDKQFYSQIDFPLSHVRKFYDPTREDVPGLLNFLAWKRQAANKSPHHEGLGTDSETLQKAWDLAKDEKIEVPCGIAVFPAEISVPPREWAERSYNVQQWTVMPAGGHFAALEEPVRLVEDVRNFFRPLR